MKLWHVSREGIARGAAISLFFGFLIPIGQIPLAAIFAVALHANLPVAAVTTLVTNPFTFAPIYYFAYRLGLLLTGAEPAVTMDAHDFEVESRQASGWVELWMNRIVRYGKPLYTRLFVLACSSAALSYFSISWIWRAATVREWRMRGWRTKRKDRNSQ